MPDEDSVNMPGRVNDSCEGMDDSLFRLAFESSDYGVIFLNADEKVVFWNDWMTSKSEIHGSVALGQSLLDVFPEIAGKRIAGAIIRSFSGIPTVLSSVLNKVVFPLFEHMDNGERQSLLQTVSVRPFSSSNGDAFCMIQINDMTAAFKRDEFLKEYAGKAHDLSKLKSEFISTVSHELRTPLTSINGSLSILSSGVVVDLPVEARTLLSIALNNTERLMLLINDILDMEKIEAGRMDFIMGPVQLSRVIKKSIECNKPYCEKYGVSLELSNKVGDVLVNADTDRLMQVMSNFLSNAAKFSGRGTTIRVNVERVDAFIRVTVSDSGPGISKEFEGRLFDKFSQADGSDRREKGGTGLGLSICKSIMDRMSGSIDFFNNPDGGASFYINLQEIGD